MKSIEELEKENKEFRQILEFYANPNNYKDVWKEAGKESPHFKYFYEFRQRTDDFDNLSEDGNYHFYAGKRARDVLKKYGTRV